MKRLAFIVSLVLLCGCDQTDSSYVSESMEEKAADTTTVETANITTETTAEIVDTTTETTTAETYENDKFAFVCGVNSIEVQKNNKTFQTIPVDCTPKEEDIICQDFNNDGFEDLCVTASVNVYGGALTCFYYRFDPETGKFVPWDMLNNIGLPLVEAKIDGRVGRKCDLYCREQPESVSEYSEYFYIWEGDELKPFARIFHHDMELNEVVGTFEHEESLYKYDENGSEYYVSELPVSSDRDW